MHGVAQSRYTHHGSCENCGSKDNVAWYESGSGYCFGCGWYYRGTSASISKATSVTDGNNGGFLRSPPDDCDSSYPDKVIEWVGKYGVTVADLIKHKVTWSNQREQLIFRFFGEGQDLVLWQARNFRHGTSHKDRFYTGGAPNEVIAAYYPEQISDTAVIVEDCISAMRVSQAGAVGIPCFSSTLSDKKLTLIAGLYDRIFFWLDYDKFKESTKLTRKAGLLGCQTRSLCTVHDPKCYSEKIMREMFV